ncbi:MAG: hypothetical protein R3223_11425, partial [Longimicrobiales bacterium]|nr:hypothetical protein [Longimicrobiales bacterium]
MDRGSGKGRRGDRKQLLDVIRRVRNRWRLRTFLRGLAVLVGAGLVAFIVTAYGLELARFSPAAVVTFRVLTYLTVAVLAYVYVVRPLAHRVTDEQVALYLEEHEPSLESAVLTAVEKAKDPDDALVVRLVTDALDRTRDVEYGQRVDRTLLYRYSGILAGVGVLGVFLFLLGPSTLRNGATALLFPNRQAEELTPFSIQVEPGDVTVAQGSDQLVSARLLGFESGEVELVTLDGDGNVVDAAPMFSDDGLDGSSVEGASEPGGFQRMMLNVDEPIRYFVRSSGVRSPTFTIDVAEIPYVDRLEMVYHFPGYTGLEPR